MPAPPSSAETDPARNPSLGLDAVELRLHGNILVPSFSHRVPPGQVLTVMGPSGSGKSTLLAFISGTLDPAFVAKGIIAVDGVPVSHLPPERRRIGILYQDDLLFPHLSVGQNLAFGLATTIKGRANRRRRIDQALADAGLDGFYDRDPATLSGGQRGRAALMRTLLSAPRAVLLDEPFSKLDTTLRDRFRRFVFGHLRDANLPAVIVTHDPADAEAADGPVLTLPAQHQSAAFSGDAA